MAYVITYNNELFRIAQNDTQKNDLNIDSTSIVAKTITDAEFDKLRKNTARAIVDSDGNVTVTDTTDTYSTYDDLEKYISELHLRIDEFLKHNTNSKNLHSAISTYKNTLKNHDFSSMTFPLNSSWEKYCSDNSIAFIHPLQIP